jgi:hypothetical protein
VRECGGVEGGLALLISRGRETSECGHNQYRRHRPCPSWLVVGSLSVGRAGNRSARSTLEKPQFFYIFISTDQAERSCKWLLTWYCFFLFGLFERLELERVNGELLAVA